MSGGAQLGERRALKLQTLLRDSKGDWRPMFALTPTDDEVRVYISPDKMPKQLATAGLGRRLREAVEAVLPSTKASGLPVHLWKWEGEISIDWCQLCCLEPTSPTEHKIYWNNDVVGDYDISKQKILQKFQELLDANPKGKGKGKGKKASVKWAL